MKRDELINMFGFKPYGKKEKKWSLVVQNGSNCEFRLFLIQLNDNASFRICIAEEEGEYIDAIDIFESQDFEKLKQFIQIVI